MAKPAASTGSDRIRTTDSNGMQVEIVRSGQMAMQVGGLTRIFRREKQQDEQFSLWVIALLLFILGSVIYGLTRGNDRPDAPPSGAITGHLGDVPPAVNSALQAQPDEAIGRMEWNDNPDALLATIRVNEPRRVGEAARALLWKRAPDGLWESFEVRIGTEFVLDGTLYTVARIDNFLVVLRDRSGTLHRVFNPRNWSAIAAIHEFRGEPPFSRRTAQVAEFGFWTVRTGTRRFLGVDLQMADGSPIPDDRMAAMVDDLEQLTMDWAAGLLEGDPIDLMAAWLPGHGYADVVVAQ